MDTNDATTHTAAPIDIPSITASATDLLSSLLARLQHLESEQIALLHSFNLTHTAVTTSPTSIAPIFSKIPTYTTKLSNLKNVMVTQSAAVVQLKRRANDVKDLKERNAVRIEQIWEKERERDRGELRARTRIGDDDYDNDDDQDQENSDERRVEEIENQIKQVIVSRKTSTTTTPATTMSNSRMIKGRELEYRVKDNNDNTSFPQQNEHLETNLKYPEQSSFAAATTSSSSDSTKNNNDDNDDDNNNVSKSEEGDTHEIVKTSEVGSSSIHGDNTMVSSETAENYSFHHDDDNDEPIVPVKMVIKRKKKVRRAEIGDS